MADTVTSVLVTTLFIMPTIGTRPFSTTTIETSTIASSTAAIFPDSAGGSTIRTPTTSDHVLLGICFIIGVLGIVGNTVMVISILIVRSFRQASNVFFFHHGLLEIAKSALIIPYALSITGKQASYCELLGAMQCVLVTTTSLNLAAITINESFIISHAVPASNNSFDEDSSGSIMSVGKNANNNDNNNKTSRNSQSLIGSRKKNLRQIKPDDRADEKANTTNQGTTDNKDAKKSQYTSSSGTIKILPALEAGTFNKPSLKRNITCVIFGVLLIWMASLVLNMGVSLITGSGQYNEKIGLCYFVYGQQKSYVVNVMWIVVTSLGVGATICCLRKLKIDLHRSQEYLARAFPANIKPNSMGGNLRQSSSNLKATSSLPQLPPQSLNSKDDLKKQSISGASNKKSSRSDFIDEKHRQRLTSIMSKQAFQQTRVLNCQFNVIVLQTISFIIFWYPLFGLIIADKDFTVDTEIYKALTVLAWLNAPLTPVFFTYFNYECYSSQVSIKLSVVGNATAEVVREQAIIADNLGKSDESSGNSEEQLTNSQVTATITKPSGPPPTSFSMSTFTSSKQQQRFQIPQHKYSDESERQRLLQFSNQAKPIYAEKHYPPQSTQPFSTFKPQQHNTFTGRSLQNDVHNIPHFREEETYWFERSRDLSSNSLHQISLQQQQQQIPRTGTFPKLVFENTRTDDFQGMTKPARSLREIRDVYPVVSGYDDRHYHPQEHRRNRMGVEFSLPPSTLNDPADVNRPHSYENITRYAFEEGHRSKTMYPGDGIGYDDSADESVDRPPNVTSWTGVARRQQQQVIIDNNMCSWRQIAKHQATTPSASSGGGSERQRPSNQRKSSFRKATSKIRHRSSSDDEAEAQSFRQVNARHQPCQRQQNWMDINRHMPPPRGILASSTSTDQEMVLPHLNPKKYLSQQRHGKQRPPSYVNTPSAGDNTGSGFKNPVYIEALRRANIRANEDDKGNSSSIPMVELKGGKKLIDTYHSRNKPHLRFVKEQSPWNKPVIDNTENEPAIAADPRQKIESDSRLDSLGGPSTCTGKSSEEGDLERESHFENDSEDLVAKTTVVIDTTTPFKNAENSNTFKPPTQEIEQQQACATKGSSVTFGYAKFESSRQDDGSIVNSATTADSIDRLQLWLGKLENDGTEPATSPLSPQGKQQPPPLPSPFHTTLSSLAKSGGPSPISPVPAAPSEKVSLIEEFTQRQRHLSSSGGIAVGPSAEEKPTSPSSPQAKEECDQSQKTNKQQQQQTKSDEKLKEEEDDQREVWI